MKTPFPPGDAPAVLLADRTILHNERMRLSGRLGKMAEAGRSRHVRDLPILISASEGPIVPAECCGCNGLPEK
jgi:hypothetical protein